MTPNLSDAEVICKFMEPRPLATIESLVNYPGTWWHVDMDAALAGEKRWKPRTLTLNECHEVEARLNDEQWTRYSRVVMDDARRAGLDLKSSHAQIWLHATAEQKTRALSAALREPCR